MTRRYFPLIFVLAAVWGASYLFIKVGVDGGFSPAALMAARALTAGAILLGYLAVTLGPKTTLVRLRAAWRPAIVLGALNAAVPFWLVAWGETRIDSSIAAIAQATVPMFSLLIGLRFLPHERIGPTRIGGLVVVPSGSCSSQVSLLPAMPVPSWGPWPSCSPRFSTRPPASMASSI